MTKYEIKTRFEGYINNIKFDDEYIYNLTRTILDIIDEVFGEYYNNKFIEDLSKAIEKASYNDSEFSFTDVENRLHNDIDDEDVQKFEDIQFSVPYINSALNENIKNGKYSHYIYHCDCCDKQLETGEKYYFIENTDISKQLYYDTHNIYCSKDCIIKHIEVKEGTLK